MKTPNAAIWAAAMVSSVVIICITVLLALGKPSDTLTSFIVAVPGALATAFGVYTAMKTQKISPRLPLPQEFPRHKVWYNQLTPLPQTGRRYEDIPRGQVETRLLL
jgi:hypothetical protein